MLAPRIALTLAALAGVSSNAHADPAAAKKANNAGMKLYKQRDYAGAKTLFEKALAEDPTFVKAHYNRASMAALVGDYPALAEEFTWLRGSTSPEAARVLKKAKTDPDFQAVRTVDEARVAMGEPRLADTPLDALVVAGGGAWNGVDEGMMEGFLDYRFGPKGKLTAREHSGEAGGWSDYSVKWKVVDRTVVVYNKHKHDVWKLEPCAEPAVPGQHCLVLDTKVLAPGRYTEPVD